MCTICRCTEAATNMHINHIWEIALLSTPELRTKQSRETETRQTGEERERWARDLVQQRKRLLCKHKVVEFDPQYQKKETETDRQE